MNAKTLIFVVLAASPCAFASQPPATAVWDPQLGALVSKVVREEKMANDWQYKCATDQHSYKNERAQKRMRDKYYKEKKQTQKHVKKNLLDAVLMSQIVLNEQTQDLPSDVVTAQ